MHLPGPAGGRGIIAPCDPDIVAAGSSEPTAARTGLSPYRGTHALVSPLVARLAGRVGQPAVLRPLMLVFTAAAAALISGTQARASLGAVGLQRAGPGGTPQLGSVVRARWSALLAGSELLHAAFSLESLAGEVIFVAGPVLPPCWRPRPARPRDRGGGGRVRGWHALAGRAARHRAPAQPRDRVPGAARRARGHLLPARGLVTLAPVSVFTGAMLAAIDLATVGFAAGHGHKPLAGPILGGYALGRAGGLWYGSRTWRARCGAGSVLPWARRRPGTATFWAMPGLAALAAVVVTRAGTIADADHRGQAHRAAGVGCPAYRGDGLAHLRDLGRLRLGRPPRGRSSPQAGPADTPSPPPPAPRPPWPACLASPGSLSLFHLDLGVGSYTP